jgi:hypothetical protein
MASFHTPTIAFLVHNLDAGSLGNISRLETGNVRLWAGAAPAATGAGAGAIAEAAGVVEVCAFATCKTDTTKTAATSEMGIIFLAKKTDIYSYQQPSFRVMESTSPALKS